MSKYTLTDTLLYLDKVSFGYPDPNNSGKFTPVLKDLTLCEKDCVREGIGATGQTIAFIGRSGRGKSTLFKGLTGLLKPTTGQVLISNLGTTNDTTDAKIVEEGDVGFVDQKYTLFRHKTLIQILRYALRKSGMSDKDKNDLITQYINEWGLMEHKDKYSCEMSGGQRQRTAIIEQLLTSKHFIVLDEPASGLDVYATEKMKEYFNKITSSDSLNTIIFSTHDLKLAVELADSIYLIGYPEGITDHSTIIKHYDLKEMGFAWSTWGEQHRELVSDIKRILLSA